MKVHKVEIWHTYTACSRHRGYVRAVTWTWVEVTCKRCLAQRKKGKG